MTNPQILSDFHTRRKLFDAHLNANKISKFTCPSCGFPTFDEKSSYEICVVCNWEDDGQDDPNADKVLGGPNSELSLTASRLKIGEELLTLARNFKGQILTDPTKFFDKLKDPSNKMDAVANKMTGQETLDHPLWNEYRKTTQEIKLDLIETGSTSV